MVRWGLLRALLVFGVFQALTNLLFAVLALVGKSHVMLVVAVVGEQLFGGMGSAAFVALLMALCDVRYTATQYALFSALAALASTRPRVSASSLAASTVSSTASSKASCQGAEAMAV